MENLIPPRSIAIDGTRRLAVSAERIRDEPCLILRVWATSSAIDTPTDDDFRPTHSVVILPARDLTELIGLLESAALEVGE